MIALRFESGASYELCDSVHSPLWTAVIPDAILNPSLTDHPHHWDSIANPDFDRESVGALAVPRHLHLAVLFAVVDMVAVRPLEAGVNEAVLLYKLVVVLVRLFDCQCIFLLALVTTNKQKKSKKSRPKKQKTAAT